jgi:iron complex outermembrane receptor protein
LNRIFFAENLIPFRSFFFKPTAFWGGVLLMCGAGRAMAQEYPRPAHTSLTDSLHALPDVQVRASRAARFAVGSRRVLIDSTTLSQQRGGTLADVLAARNPIYFKTYGPGQLSSITVRGTAARHTAVLWNGFNISLPSLGESDFATLPASANSRIEVQLGPAGAAFGSGAVGGAVLLSSPLRWGRKGWANVQADAGSFGLWGGSVEGGFSNERVAAQVTASARTAQNDFTYAEPGTGRTRRLVNAALRHQLSVAEDLAWRVGTGGEVLASVWLTDTEREIQPSLGAANRHATQRDRNRRVLLGYRHTISDRQSWAVRGAWLDDGLNYWDDDLNSPSRVFTTQGQAEYTAQVTTQLGLHAGVEVQRFDARISDYGRNLNEYRSAGFLLARYDPLPRLHLSAQLRQAVLPGRRPPLLPSLGAEWALLEGATQHLTAKASAARSYRAPTLNERYWSPGGNPNLLPESGMGYEAGLAYKGQPAQPSPLRWEAELTAYRQTVDNWVQWLPAAEYAGSYSPQNLRQVRTQGLETSAELAWKRPVHGMRVRAAYAFTQARKLQGYAQDTDPVGVQLPYVPLHAATLSTDHTWRGWQAGAALQFTGYRYTNAAAEEFLPSYLLLNANLGYTLRLGAAWACTLLLQGTNLTNRAYQSYAYRVMPPRAGQLSLRVAWR